MKKSLLFLPVIAIAVTAWSFTLKKTKKFIPPGTVQVNETFFVDETEISNFSWQEYEFWTRIKYGAKSPEHIAALPDTTVWRDNLAYNEPYVSYYYRHPAYKDYPVVGISYEQAQAFCKWRTERVKEFWYISHKSSLNIEYRLPSKEEWELVSCNGTDVMYGHARNSKGLYLFNHLDQSGDSLSTASKGQKNYGADVTAPVNSYWKNRFGVYNLFGNVAEMINEKGISKGGSWRHKFEECRAGKDISYTAPKAWLGFRCVCVVTPA